MRLEISLCIAERRLPLVSPYKILAEEKSNWPPAPFSNDEPIPLNNSAIGANQELYETRPRQMNASESARPESWIAALQLTRSAKTPVGKSVNKLTIGKTRKHGTIDASGRPWCFTER
jgi:hypothetical protein